MNCSLLIQVAELDPAILGKPYFILIPVDPVTKNPCSAAVIPAPRVVLPIGICTELVIW